ncbi:MAG: hypothetical protein AVDCRST_MAG57-1752 [uncultured Blastococcus sp.]|uniref:Secreted protein n=1 Tax=uncultured Blastococcus sp. TaxID=217144 RepID=A0A6J4I697_9ACTN|nr:MAG: hypothetical protein AVDCRST_MAG57-1752 [uncultured Blastococcus sp.]
MKALLVVLLLLGGLFVLVDRVAVHVAETQVGEQIAEQAGLAGAPDVDIAGFPFLTQALGGTYDDVRLSLTAAELGQPEGTRADIALNGVHVPLSAVVSGSLAEVPVDSIDGTATLSYALLSAQLGPDTELTPEEDRLRITRTVEILGRPLRLTAVGQVTLEGNDLVVDVQEATGAGVEVPGFLLERSADVLDLRYAVPELPFGLELTGVRPAADGVDIRVAATDTVLRAGG